ARQSIAIPRINLVFIFTSSSRPGRPCVHGLNTWEAEDFAPADLFSSSPARFPFEEERARKLPKEWAQAEETIPILTRHPDTQAGSLSLRTLTGGIMHETSTFAAGTTTLRDFETGRGLLRGDELFDRFRGANFCCGGFLDGAERHGFDLVP